MRQFLVFFPLDGISRLLLTVTFMAPIAFSNLFLLHFSLGSAKYLTINLLRSLTKLKPSYLSFSFSLSSFHIDVTHFACLKHPIILMFQLCQKLNSFTFANNHRRSLSLFLRYLFPLIKPSSLSVSPILLIVVIWVAFDFRGHGDL